MEIIKIIHNWSKTNPNGLTIDCGLGDDGELYYRLTNPRAGIIYDKWYPLSKRYCPTIREMITIVNEFKVLLTFM